MSELDAQAIAEAMKTFMISGMRELQKSGVQLQVELAREDLKAIVMAQLCIGAIASAPPTALGDQLLDQIEDVAERVLLRSVGPEEDAPGPVELTDDDLEDLLPGNGDNGGKPDHA